MRVRPDYVYRQSAVIPFRCNANGLSVLLITTRKRSRWIIPKGVVEPDLTALDSALKEADEEAGVRGRPLAEPLGSYAHEKWGDLCEVEVYAMAVEQQRDQWPEDFRGRE